MDSAYERHRTYQNAAKAMIRLFNGATASQPQTGSSVKPRDHTNGQAIVSLNLKGRNEYVKLTAQPIASAIVNP
jgi:hypothetical protein